MATFDPTLVNEIDQDTVEQTGPQYPTIQWHYGDPKMKKAGGMDWMGGWFIPADMVDAEKMTEAGWEFTTWSHNDGSETEGFWKREITVAVINRRRRWEVYDGHQRRAFAWKDYDKASEVGRPSSRAHVLVLVKGLEDMGPFVLTLKGMASMYFEGSRNVSGALTKFAGTVIRAANEASRKAGAKGKRWPSRFFWLPVGANRNGVDGKPEFTEVGRGNDTSHVVLPIPLGLPAKWEEVDLNRFYVGRDLHKVVDELYQESLEWKAAWDTIEEQPSEKEQAEQEVKKEVEQDDSVLEEMGL